MKRKPAGRRLLDAICKSSLQPGHWEQLSKEDQDYVRRRIARQLRGQPHAFLEALADPGPGTPTLTLDDELNVSYTTQANDATTPDSTANLESYIRRANELGYLFHGYDPRGVPVFTRMEHLDRHMTILGTSGTGKSNLLGSYFTQLASQGGPMILIDPHADLIRDIVPRLPPERLRDVVYINPADLERTWGINLLQFGRTLLEGEDADPDAVEHVLEVTVQTIVQALSVIQEDESGYSAGVSIQSTLQMAAQAAAEYNPASTFVDVYQIIANRRIPELIKDSIHTQAVRQYVEDTLPHLRTEYLERVRNKLQRFLSTAMVNMFCRRQESKSLRHLIEENRILLFDLDRDGLPYQVSNLIGFLLVTLVMLVVDHRKPPPGEELRPLYLVVDEFQNVASRSTMRWLAEARKRRAGLIAALQHLDQVPQDVRDALGNASTWCILRTSANDAQHLAPSLALDANPSRGVTELTSMPQFQMRLQYDEEDTQIPSRPMRRSLVTVHTQPLPPVPAARRGVLDAVRQASLHRYARKARASDKETILAVGDDMTHELLLAIYDAHQACHNPKYHFGTDALLGQDVYRRALGARRHGTVTLAVIRQVLALKGITVTPERLKALRSSLVLRKLVSVRKSSPGFDETVLLGKGLEAIRSWIVPNHSSSEGGAVHKQCLLRLYQALTRTSALPIHVPVQGQSTYTPDMVLKVPQSVPCSWMHHLSRKEVHFQVEVTTTQHTRKILGNMAGALQRGAFPIHVLVAEDASPASLGRVAGFHRRILDAATGRDGAQPVPGDLGQIVAADPDAFAVWIVTSDKRLYAYQALANRLVEVVAHYQSPGNHEDPNTGEAQPPPSATSPAKPSTPDQAPSPGDAKAAFKHNALAMILNHPSGWLPRNTLKHALEEEGHVLEAAKMDAWAQELGFDVKATADDVAYRFD